MNIAIVGYGRMGRIIERIAEERGHRITLKLDEINNADYAGITAANFKGVGAAIEELDRLCQEAVKRSFYGRAASGPPC